MIINGLVKSFEGNDAYVLLEHDGERQKRRMARTLLRRNGIKHEGQAFTMKFKESGAIVIAPVGDPAKRAIKPIRPGADFSKFKRMP